MVVGSATSPAARPSPRINAQIKDDMGQRKESPISDWVLPYSQTTTDHVDWVGAKSANLGEVLNWIHPPIPEGFAITTRAFEYFLSAHDLSLRTAPRPLWPRASEYGV
jgi:pyruvate, water dikinase